MFIQSAPPGSPHLAVTMFDHTALSGQFARAFGNDRFEAPVPLEPTVYAIANHDAGWLDFDRDPATDPETNLPYSVFGTPAPLILPTSKLSPDYNQRHHPFSGLLSSMHTCGIYNGRYGLTSSGRLDRIAPHDRPKVEALMASEEERQQALKAELSGSPETAAWIEEKRLFQNYALMQFCDLLAIYFNGTHPSQRGEKEFTRVPASRERDVTIRVRPASGEVYAFDPFPFAAEGAEFAFAGRLISPGQHEREGGWAKVLRTAPSVWQRFTAVAG